MSTSARAYLVESIPKGLEDLRGTPGMAYTEDVLVQLTSRAKSTIDLTAMYWALLADPGSDEKGFTPEEFDAMGAGAGRALYEALRAAAQRGVHIRILQSPGFSSQQQGSDALQADFPDPISIHSVEMGKWYGGGGIMHQKVWIFDQHHLYLGSANMDWKSITQVKEMAWSSKIVRSSLRTPASISRPGGLSPPFRRRASRCSTPWRASIGACRHGRFSCRRSSAQSQRGPAGSLRPPAT